MFRQLWLNALCLISLMICLGLGQVAAQGVTASVQSGLERYQSGDLTGAIVVWRKALADQPSETDRVVLLKSLARAYSQIGQSDQAVDALNLLIAHYQKIDDRVQLGRILTEQAQAYSNLGQQRRAIALLCGDAVESNCRKDTALTIAQEQSDQLGESAGWGSLGNAYPVYVSAAKNDLGNTYANLAKRDYRYAEFASESGDQGAIKRFTQQAIKADQQAIPFFEATVIAARQQNNITAESQALLNLATVYQRSFSRSPLVTSTLKQVFDQRDRLPDSRDKVYALNRLAKLQLQSTATKLNPNVQCSASTPADTLALLKQAIAVSQRINDRAASAFALGRLGHLYECQRDFTQALDLTEQAQFAAQNLDNHYLWDWQTGRILQAQGKTATAIGAYENSVKALKAIRADLALASRDFQFDFRDVVEPVYRELTELQLNATPANQTLTQQASLEPALATIDGLRLAELQNYLGADCTISPSATPIALVNEQTAVVSTIMLKDRVAVILTLPDAPSIVRWITAPSQTVRATVNDLRLKLENRSDLTNSYQAPAQQVYDWLIRPFAAELQAAKIETLVFIQDGILRSIPMTALYDGKQFLVEQYAIASTLSFSLIDPTQLEQRSLRVLGFGLTKSSTIGSTVFAPLSFVKTELDRITKTRPGSKEFVDAAFTIDRLKQELTQNAFPIVHLATHGKFGIDSRDTFLVTGKQVQNDNEKLTMNQFYQILQTIGKPLELLTLTACETAVGSDRDALGIAGISLQAGAKSAIASLWQVDDRATAELIGQFYQNLSQGMGRAKALQTTQKSWLAAHPDVQQHPGYWAALMLVGNWL
jgi:CHAT domain-containing protein